MNRKVAISIRTTGRSARKGSRLIEFAAVDYDKFVKGEKSSIWFLCDPCIAIPDKSTIAHGRKDSDVFGLPKFRDFILCLSDFVGDAELISWCGGYDLSFINSELNICGIHPIQNSSIDLITIAHAYFGDSVSIDEAAERFGFVAKRETSLDRAEAIAGIYNSLEFGV